MPAHKHSESDTASAVSAERLSRGKPVSGVREPVRSEPG